jgi:hypothetical protein
MLEEINQVVDTTSSNDDDLDLELDFDDNDEDLSEELTKEREKARAILARAKKAEAELKELKSKVQTKSDGITKSEVMTEELVETTVLKAQGFDEELLEQLKKVAKVTGKSLLSAQADPIFVAIKTQREEQVKAEQARLGASRGAQGAKEKKTFNSKKLTPEEHKEMWRNLRNQ